MLESLGYQSMTAFPKAVTAHDTVATVASLQDVFGLHASCAARHTKSQVAVHSSIEL